MATASATDLAVFLSVAGDVPPTFKEHIRFAIRLYNAASPTKSVQRGAAFHRDAAASLLRYIAACLAEMIGDFKP